MDSIYDCIVIGAGNGGLIAALELVKAKKKVLVLESNATPGGFATSFIRGRFEFEASLHKMTEYGEEKDGLIYKLFDSLDLKDKIKFTHIKEAFHVYSKDKKIDYIMPFGIQEFIEKMEEYVPNSKISMNKFFILAEEIEHALIYIEQNQQDIDLETLKNEYANFMKVSSYSVDKVLKLIKMPKKAQEILTTYWINLGSSTSTLSFVHFASMMLSYLKHGAVIPINKSYEISAILAEEIIKNGGKIKYLSTVEEILFASQKVVGVKLIDGKEFGCKHVIYNGSPNILYGKMIPSEMVPPNALKLTNSRVLGARGFTIFLGLNQSANDIGLNDYSYYIYNSLDSNKEYQNMSNIKNNSCIATVINKENANCSPKGTTIMMITSLFFGDCFSNKVTNENYFELKNQIADNIINNFEITTGINIRNYIEEIEIATPVTYARYGGHPDGVIYGYKPTGLDNILPRMLNKDNECFIPDIRICGSFSELGVGYNNTYMSGFFAAHDTLLDMKGEE